MVSKLNYFTVKEYLSPYYSPKTILDQQPLYYNKHDTLPFGWCVQENNDKNPKNSNVLWKIDGIYLQSLDKIQGGNEVFYIHSHRIITRGEIV